MRRVTEIDRLLALAEKELARLDAERAAINEKINNLKSEKAQLNSESLKLFYEDRILVTNKSSQEEKISLFRSLFRVREDVYPKRFESIRTGKSGYQPVCRNEWLQGICRKPKIKCNDCDNREFLPVTNAVIRNHLLGVDPQDKSKRDFTI